MKQVQHTVKQMDMALSKCPPSTST